MTNGHRHTITPKLLSTGEVEIVIFDTLTNQGRFVILSNAEAEHFVSQLERLTRIGRKL